MVPTSSQWNAFMVLFFFLQKIGPEKVNFLKNTNFVKIFVSLYRAMIEKNKVSTVVKMFKKVNYGVRFTK